MKSSKKVEIFYRDFFGAGATNEHFAYPSIDQIGEVNHFCECLVN